MTSGDTVQSGSGDGSHGKVPVSSSQAGTAEAEAQAIAMYVWKNVISFYTEPPSHLAEEVQHLLTTYARQRVLEAEQRCADWLRKQGHVLGAPGIANDMLAALRQSAEAGAGKERS